MLKIEVAGLKKIGTAQRRFFNVVKDVKMVGVTGECGGKL